MSERNEFDDLARRKLEERETVFHEGDWTAAERLIAAQHNSTGGWKHWAIGGIALLLIGVTAWWSTSNSSTETRIVSVAANAAVEQADPRTNGTEIGTSVANNEHDRIAAITATVTTDIREDLSARNIAMGTSTTDLTSPQEQASLRIENVSATPKKKEEQRSNSLKTTRAVDPVVIAPVPEKKKKDMPLNGPTLIVAKENNENVRTFPNELEDLASSVSSTTGQRSTEAENSATAETDRGPEQVFNNAISPASSSTEDHFGSDAVVEQVEPDRSTEGDQSVATRTVPEEELQVPASVVMMVEDPTRTATRDEVIAAVVLASDSVVPASDQPQDSALVVQAPLPPLDMVTASSPWEIGILFGGLRSSSTFTGGNSADWNGGLTGRWSPTFGAEVMHMGRNFGIGGGIRYTTYEEELSVEGKSLSTVVIRDSNYFEPFNTTILYVLGIDTINGQEWYITESRDTTINILVLGTHTFTSSRQLIDALRVVNRVSYLEVPLLLDAHVTQGSWMFGLRGGPMIGVLTGRRGTIPNAEFDGYTPFTTEQFRRTQLGLTARAYIRYKFTNGWAIGFEPTWRTQLGNAFSSGDLVRTNSGIGGMISVTYRLR